MSLAPVRSEESAALAGGSGGRGAALAALRADPAARLYSGRELERRQRDPEGEALPTTLAPLDRLLGGGLPRGRLVELVGRRSSGRFSAVLAALAGATARGEAAALVDLADGFDPAAALDAGVVLERLLWARPRHLKQALIGAETLLAAGFPLVAVDLGQPPVPGGRGGEAAWMRLTRAAASQRAALLVTSPYRACGTAAAIVLHAGRGRPRWRGRGAVAPLLAGLDCRLHLDKRRHHHAPPAPVSLRLAAAEALAWPRRAAGPDPTDSPRPAGAVPR